jgi:uncharacterized protein (TIGR00106 family)
VSGVLQPCRLRWVGRSWRQRDSLHPNGTAIEGEWEPVVAAIEAGHQVVHTMGCPRVCTDGRVGIRTDKGQTQGDKVASLQALL